MISRSKQEEMLHDCSFPEDLETFEHAVQENISYLFGEECEPDLQDEVLYFPPSLAFDLTVSKAYFILDNKIPTPTSRTIGRNR